MLAKPWGICGSVSSDPAAYTRQKQPLIALALRLRLSRARARTPTRTLDPDPDPSPEPLALIPNPEPKPGDGHFRGAGPSVAAQEVHARPTIAGTVT